MISAHRSTHQSPHPTRMLLLSRPLSLSSLFRSHALIRNLFIHNQASKSSHIDTDDFNSEAQQPPKKSRSSKPPPSIIRMHDDGSAVTMSPEDQEYWSEILKQVDAPVLKTLMAKLDPSHPIGFWSPKGTSSASDTAASSTDSSAKKLGIACYDFFLEVKRKHPRAIALVQIGDFYESVGWDAILLCHLHGLNPMAPLRGVARCGVPLNNLPRAVRALNGEDISVAICPEVEKSAYGLKSAPKSRFVKALSTPSNPYIFYEAAEGGGAIEDYYTEGLPLIGVASSKSGHMFFEYRHELKSVLVTEGMTPEVLISRLQNQRAAPPLLLHSSIKEVSTSMTSSMELLIKSHSKGMNVVKVFSTPQPSPSDAAPTTLEGFLDQVRLEMGMKPGEGIKEIESSKHLGRGQGPIPPYLSTINNLGLNNSPGMPNLLDSLLDSSRQSGRSSAEPRRWMERLLRQPPPPFMALKIHEAVVSLWDASCPLPSVYSMMTPKKVVDILSKEDQAACSFFRELVMLLEPAQELLTPDPNRGLRSKGPAASSTRSDPLLPIADGALGYASWEMQIHVPKLQLLADLDKSVKEIKRVVDMTGEASSPWAAEESEGELEEEEGEGEGEEAATKYQNAAGIRRKVPFSHDSNIEQVMQRMEESNEGKFKGRISPQIMAPHIKKVDKLRLAIDKEVRRLMGSLTDDKDLAKHRPRVKYDDDDRALYLYVSKNSLALKNESSIKTLDLKTPMDRKGKLVTEGKVSPQLESLLAEYRLAVDAACEEVRAQLKALCRSLHPQVGSLLLSAYSSIIARALIDHVDEAKRRGWCLPSLVQMDQKNINKHTDIQVDKSEAAAGEASMRMRMEIQGLWPYWKQKEEAVKNDLVLERTVLLTGPNMAGKSTVLRSIAAIALLAACGLAVPAEKAPSVPFYDSFMLRNYSGDSPLENLSSFALEMTDVKALLRDATHRSLILLDELGKGTEVDSATALSAALLEGLCNRGSSVVFATHLHDLVKLMGAEEVKGRLEYMSMQVVPRSPSPSSAAASQVMKKEEEEAEGEGGMPRLVPTWRIVPGSCTESLACQVALEMGIDNALVSRAYEVYGQLRGEKRRAALALSSDGLEIEPSSSSLSSSLSSPSPYSLSRTPSPPSFSLEDATEVLQEIALSLTRKTSKPSDDQGAEGKEISRAHNEGMQSSTVSCHDEEADKDESLSEDLFLQIHTCSGNQVPPPSHSMRSATYIIQYSSGYFYCGDSDSIRDRLADHRKKRRSNGTGGPKQQRMSHKGPGCSVAYILLEAGEGGKSLARKIQTRTIKEMKRRGFPMASSGDETLKSFGG